jgi:hypothetical protein
MCALRHHALIFICIKSVWWEHRWWENAHVVFMQILEYSHENLSIQLDVNIASDKTTEC